MARAKTTGISRRTALKGMAAGAAALGAYGVLAKPAIAQARTVNFTLAWLPTGQYAYMSVASQLGFWKKRGLDVTVSRGYGSLAAIQAVATGKFEVGSAATSAVLLSIIKKTDIQITATHGYDSSMGILVPANGKIKTPKDLEGKQIGVTAAGGDTPFLPAYYKLVGVDPAKVTTVSLDSQIIEQSVISGRVDCMVAFGMSSIPNFMMQNFPVKLFPFDDVGLTFYWINTICGSGLLKKDPALVAAVNDGMMEGMKYAMLNREEAVERHMKQYPEIAISKNGKLFTELGCGMVSVSMTAPESQKNFLGFSDLAKIDRMCKLVKTYTGAPGDQEPPDVASYCTNDHAGKVTLSAEEWERAKSAAASYAKMLGKA